MKRTARLLSVMALAGLALVAPPSTVLAENTPWEFSSNINPLTDRPSGSAQSLSLSRIGAFISFSCVPGNPVDKFLVLAAPREADQHSEGVAKVGWRVDSEPLHRAEWHVRRGYGVGLVGRSAYEFAVAIMGARHRVIFATHDGIIELDVRGSTKAISQLLEFCGLPR